MATKTPIMKINTLIIILFAAILSYGFTSVEPGISKQSKEHAALLKDPVLRHVVLFKFKEGASPEKIKIAEDAFNALPAKIPQIKSFEWGLNNSPEGLDKGFTHCYFLTFKSEADRAIYLPHPDHKAFGKTLDGILDDVLVVDYWTD